MDWITLLGLISVVFSVIGGIAAAIISGVALFLSKKLELNLRRYEDIIQRQQGIIDNCNDLIVDFEQLVLAYILGKDYSVVEKEILERRYKRKYK